MNIYEIPLNKLLKNQKVYQVFYESFRKDPWLDLTALVDSETTINGLYEDGIVPSNVMNSIMDDLKSIQNAFDYKASMVHHSSDN